MRTCPHCKGKISDTAKKCKHCGEWINNSNHSGKNKIQESNNEREISNDTRDTGIGIIVALFVILIGVILNFISSPTTFFGNSELNNGYNSIQYDDGDKYEGNIVNNQRNGQGTYYREDGERYEGNWKNDKREGKGTFYYADGGKYIGDWKNDKREGYGKYYGTDGYIYEGYYKNDYADGDSIEYRSDGRRFEGDYKVGYRYNGKVLNNYGKQIGYVKNGIFYNNDGSYIQTFYKFDEDPEGLLK